MIISPGRRAIFVHIPKTGGTALALALEARAMKDDILIGDTPKARARRGRLKGLHAAGRLWKHSTLADIDGIVTTDQMPRYQVFTLIRNPWDRIASYYHWLRGQAFGHPAVALSKTLAFDAFLDHPQIRVPLAAAPYGSYVRDAGGVDRCSLFLRLERLDEDIPRLESLLDLKLPALSRVNVSDRPRDWRALYSDAAAARVAEIAAEDIARFGYRFDPDPPR